jgi:lysozyme family protein
MSFFDAAFAIVVGEEGNYSNDPQDPGGETHWGISKREYPNLDIAKLTIDQARSLYQRDYWNALDCDSRPWEMALVLFDCGVNQGVSAAKGLLPLVVSAGELQAERALRYARAETFGRFGRGWMRRLFDVFKLAQVTPK